MVISLFRIYAMLAVASFCVAVLWQPSMIRHAYSMTDYIAAFYPQAIGERDGRPCPSYPVCSLYAHQALERYGLLLGSWIALDRLIHEGGDIATGPFVRVQGESRLYDTLERNTFWIGGGYDSDK
jgi:putative component of membrane protein insertase Oxa1/YidC/SpoIIIJ protein YidD